MAGRIIGIGAYIPEKILTNDDLSHMVETNDAWITERTGIKERRISDPFTESPSQMAEIAAKRAVEDAGIDPLDIDLIITSSTTPNKQFPGMSCCAQAAIGAKNAGCYDVNSACPGWVAAMTAAQAYMIAGQAQKILVIGTECTSNYINWNDRGTCILFGDGAGAVVLENDPEVTSDFILRADGTKGNVVFCESMKQRDHEGEDFINSTYFNMDGREVYKFAVTSAPQIILDLLAKMGKTTDDIDYFVMHQANQRILDAIEKRLKVSKDKIPSNIAKYGNTSSASIPIILREMKDAGQIKKGTKIITCSFGAGLTWGAQYLEF